MAKVTHNQDKALKGLSDYKYGFNVKTKSVYKAEKGLTEELVRRISEYKKEPEWMLKFRLDALKIYREKKMPSWGADLSGIDFENIHYYVKPSDRPVRDWDDVPAEIKETFERLGVPEAERKFLAGSGAMFESETVYHNLKENLRERGVIFEGIDEALRLYPDIFREYFATVVPPGDNKFAALNSAVWSGGSFIYVPKGVHIELPLQAYFRINAENMGQFERTLIIADEGSSVHYVEGCLPAGEQVSKGDRWVNIESVKPGDLVVDENGEMKKVKAVMARKYKGKILKITPISTYNAFRLTPEHPVLGIKRKDVTVKRKARNNWLSEVNSMLLLTSTPKYVKVDEMEVGDFLVFPKIASSTKTKLSHMELCFLGWYLAEGSTYVHNKLNMPVISISLNSTETENIHEVEMLMSVLSGKNVYKIFDKNKNGVNLVCYSRKLRNLALKHCGKGSRTKVLGKEIIGLPWEKVRPLIDCYFKGDGSVYKKGRHMIRASTASEHLARQIQELLSRGGYYASINIRKGGQDTIMGRKIIRHDQYVLYYSPAKRWSEVRKTDNYFLVPIKNIEKEDYDGFVFNLDVNKPDSYLVRGFAVHNCTAPTYSSDSLHAAVVEIIVKKGARIQYSTVQNWSNNVYNLVTKRAKAFRDAEMVWLDCNLGSKITMKYPAVLLMEPGAKAEVQSIAFAGAGQIQDAGAKIFHLAADTSSIVNSKSISMGGGRSSYRGLIKAVPGAHGSKSKVVCNALLLDKDSRSDTYPTMDILEDDVTVEHEATVSKIGEEQMFYLMSRGLNGQEAATMIVNGFIDPIVKQLPMEYAVEMNRLIEMEMEGSIG
ncbi:Fe-S cluster assembly protein SufB [Patescibacteria group bacterium]|nr:Fe-S cluster assembly protein SufB [Patescibacteria group bacterium]MBU1702899.1 Fe-S cluster assembly protein SufB [Patescibacteria group bacterium]MBU1954064.1 Fe-S cluster assembly protein SufB [Patescibacteria group bacterium]